MGRRAALLLALAFAAPAAGCSSPDYGRARETRFDRPYRGGAADVPDGDEDTRGGVVRAPERRPNALDFLGWLGALGLLFSHGVDPTAPSNRGLQPVAAYPAGR